jgi:glycosyltransferase involved in cell wall biosynthesis
LRIENVTFAGWQPDPFPYYASCDLTVLPSISQERLLMHDRVVEVRGNEGLPRTNLEAMCFRLPVVSTDIAGVREQVVDGDTGIVVPPGDEAALADALGRLIEDRGLRESMGAAGRRRVEEVFSIDRYVSSVVDVYDRLHHVRVERVAA